MEVTDEAWQRCFGTADSQIEPIPKLGKTKLNRPQLAAKMILDTARLRDAVPAPTKPARAKTLFD